MRKRGVRGCKEKKWSTHEQATRMSFGWCRLFHWYSTQFACLLVMHVKHVFWWSSLSLSLSFSIECLSLFLSSPFLALDYTAVKSWEYSCNNHYVDHNNTRRESQKMDPTVEWSKYPLALALALFPFCSHSSRTLMMTQFTGTSLETSAMWLMSFWLASAVTVSFYCRESVCCSWSPVMYVSSWWFTCCCYCWCWCCWSSSSQLPSRVITAYNWSLVVVFVAEYFSLSFSSLCHCWRWPSHHQ